MEKNSFFYISGLISLTFYLIFCFAILLYINQPKPKKFDSVKTTVLELELISTNSKKKSVSKKSTTKNKQVKVQKSTSKSSEQKSVDAKSLFANVKTKAKKVIKEETHTVNESIDPSRFKSKFEKLKKSENIKINDLLTNPKVETKMPTITTPGSGKQHEYYSKIKEILWQRWNPAFLEAGLVVKVLVMITNSGQFDYRIMKYSSDDRFDESLKEFLNKQINEYFPPHTIDSQVDIIINFKSEK